MFSAAYLFRDADHLIKTFRSDIGKGYYHDDVTPPRWAW